MAGNTATPCRGHKDGLDARNVRQRVPALLACIAFVLLATCSDAPAGNVQATVAIAPPSSGEAVAGRLGCGACHAGLPAPDAASRRSLPLGTGSVTTQRVLDALDGRAGMPDFHLDEAERLALAAFLGNDAGQRAFRRRIAAYENVDSAAGRRIYIALNCAGCHETPGVEPAPVGPVLAMEGSRVTDAWLRAYIRQPYAVRPFGAGGGGRMPRFAMSGDDADSIAVFLRRGTVALPAWTPDTLSAFAAAKERSLVEARYSCLGCHAVNGSGGRIGPDLAMSAARLQPAFLRAVIEAPGHLAPGTIMPPTRAPDVAIDRVASWIATLQPVASADSPRAGYLSLIENALAEGAAGVGDTYAHYCSACHGEDGTGTGYNARFLPVRPADHTDAASMSARTDDRLYDAIVAGARVLDGSPAMPGFGTALEPALVRMLVGRIREFCNCAGPAWSRDGGSS